MRPTNQHLLAAAFGALLLPACISTVDTGPREASPRVQAAEPAQAASVAKDAGEDAEEAEQKARKQAYKAEDREHEKAQAQIDYRLAQMSTDASVKKAATAVEDARRELGLKQQALALFNEHERPQKLAEGQLSLDQAMHRRELQQDELNELIAMYEAEDFAEMTKELVLKRGRKSLEFAERNLALQQKEYALLGEQTLPKQERELTFAVEKAERAVRDAEQGLAKAELEAKKQLASVEHKLAKLERPLED